MTNQPDTRPICGMCVVTKSLRPRMYEVAPGVWDCPVCQCRTINPTDADRTAEDMAVMFHESTPEEIRARDEREAEVYDRGIRVYQRGPIIKKGQSRSKGSKKVLPKDAPRWTVF